MPSPMPVAAPVMTATLFSSLIVFQPHSSVCPFGEKSHAGNRNLIQPVGLISAVTGAIAIARTGRARPIKPRTETQKTEAGTEPSDA